MRLVLTRREGTDGERDCLTTWPRALPPVDVSSRAVFTMRRVSTEDLLSGLWEPCVASSAAGAAWNVRALGSLPVDLDIAGQPRPTSCRWGDDRVAAATHAGP